MSVYALGQRLLLSFPGISLSFSLSLPSFTLFLRLSTGSVCTISKYTLHIGETARFKWCRLSSGAFLFLLLPFPFLLSSRFPVLFCLSFGNGCRSNGSTDRSKAFAFCLYKKNSVRKEDFTLSSSSSDSKAATKKTRQRRGAESREGKKSVSWRRSLGFEEGNGRRVLR